MSIARLSLGYRTTTGSAACECKLSAIRGTARRQATGGCRSQARPIGQLVYKPYNQFMKVME